MGGVFVGQPGGNALLIFGIGGVAKVKEKGGHFALLGGRKQRETAFDLVNAHGFSIRIGRGDASAGKGQRTSFKGAARVRRSPGG